MLVRVAHLAGDSPGHVKAHDEHDQREAEASPGVDVQAVSRYLHEILFRESCVHDFLHVNAELFSLADVIVVDVGLRLRVRLDPGGRRHVGHS